MSSIWFFSDPHIGTMRTSHTTQASRLRLRDALYEQAMDIMWPSEPVYCLGDLFDTESNDERVIQHGYRVAQQCEKVLAGNHDLPNREGKLSSLQLIAGMLEEDQVVLGSVDEPGFQVDAHDLAHVYLVPHMATQALFDQSLQEVHDFAGREVKDRPKILCLHCNYNSGFIQNDASLNLTTAQADWLLERFDYVLLGHEHVPRKLHGGQLIILGNTHPTSFSDISRKVIWEFNDTGFREHEIWSTDGFMSLNWEDASTEIEGVQFLDIVGSAPSDQLPKIAASIAKLWRDNPNLLMVRNSVESEFVAPEVHQATRSLDLPARISTALADTDLLPVWQSYLEQAQ